MWISRREEHRLSYLVEVTNLFNLFTSPAGGGGGATGVVLAVVSREAGGPDVRVGGVVHGAGQAEQRQVVAGRRQVVRGVGHDLHNRVTQCGRLPQTSEQYSNPFPTSQQSLVIHSITLVKNKRSG